MSTKLIQLLKVVTLSFFWLIFPPAFFFLSKWWYPLRKQMRRLLFAISPLVVVFVFYFLYATAVLTTDALRGSKWTIERKTEMDFPSYNKNNLKFWLKMLEENSMNSLQGDHRLEYTARLKPSECDEFFKTIDQLITDSTYTKTIDKDGLQRFWSVNTAGIYTFSHLKYDPEEYLNISINPKTYEMWVDFGTW